MRQTRPTAVLLALLVLSACGAEPAGSPLAVPDGYRAEVVVDGLAGPTQIALGPDGRLWVAQLGDGGEGGGDGEVVAVDLGSGEREVLLDRLAKPTGLAVAGGALWLALERDLVRAPLDADGLPGAPEVVLGDLPTNGRSNGTLTVTPAGTLLYETSGTGSGPDVPEGSGTLWELDPADPAAPRAVATGLKGAYAHAAQGERLWTTEIADGRFDGEAPPDELNLVRDGASYGWPRCIGDRDPVEEHGATAQECAGTEAPLALFEPGATPVGLALWEDDLLVSLWTRGEVVRVPAAGGTPEPFLTGLAGPQHLLALDDGALLVVEHGSGRVHRLTSVS